MGDEDETRTEGGMATILLVDDQADHRALGEAHLQAAGFLVELASNGREALLSLEQRTADLVLLDLMMPDPNGLEVLAHLRRNPETASLPIIIATSSEDRSDVLRAFELGANDFVTKPLTWSVVLARIRAHLRGRPSTQAPGPELEGWVAGRYRLQEKIGQGRHGEVWTAFDSEKKREVALKLPVRHEVSPQAGRELRLRREGKALGDLDHRHVIQIYDGTFDRGGEIFLALERLQGHTLDVEIQNRGQLSEERILEVVQPIGSALAHCQHRGVIQGDLKPSNIFLHRDGSQEVVKVFDFSLAHWLEEEQEVQLPAPGRLPPGTPAYMAPERCEGAMPDSRTEVYSLGVMLYEMLTGHLPFQVDDGNILRLMRLHAAAEVRSPRELRPGLGRRFEQAVLDALAKDPAKRPGIEVLVSRLTGAGP